VTKIGGERLNEVILHSRRANCVEPAGTREKIANEVKATSADPQMAIRIAQTCRLGRAAILHTHTQGVDK